jgi:hypothetical protein
MHGRDLNPAHRLILTRAAGIVLGSVHFSWPPTLRVGYLKLTNGAFALLIDRDMV